MLHKRGSEPDVGTLVIPSTSHTTLRGAESSCNTWHDQYAAELLSSAPLVAPAPPADMLGFGVPHISHDAAPPRLRNVQAYANVSEEKKRAKRHTADRTSVQLTSNSARAGFHCVIPAIRLKQEAKEERGEERAWFVCLSEKSISEGMLSTRKIDPLSSAWHRFLFDRVPLVPGSTNKRTVTLAWL